MKIKLTLIAALIAAFALVLAACPSGSGADKSQNATVWPDFSNAQKLDIDTPFPDPANTGFMAYQWAFTNDGENDEDFGAPYNTKTFKESTYLIIASKGGGLPVGSGTTYTTQFNSAGIKAIKFKVDGTNDNWANTSYFTLNFQPRFDDVNTQMITIPHSLNEIVYFVYDLSAFDSTRNAVNNRTDGSKSQIVFKIDWGADVKALGQYQAYITSANLTQGAGVSMKVNGGTSSLVDGAALGWITKNTGLTPAQ